MLKQGNRKRGKAMTHEVKHAVEYPAAFPLTEETLPQTGPSDTPEIMSLINRRSSPGVVVMGPRGEILLMNQQANDILNKIRGGRGPSSRTEEGKLVQRLHELRTKILSSVSKSREEIPVCELLPLRGTTFSLRGIILEGARQEQAPVMILIEPIQERAGTSPSIQADGIKLTKREEEICRLISRGLINKEIASALGIGVHTVKDHVKNIMKKLKASSRAGIVARIAVGNRPNGGAGPAK
jgi:DNA-binding CsgD family transcriptional regulator